MITIKVFDSYSQDNSDFYLIMGKYFASLEIKKELESQLYNKYGSLWYIIYDDYKLVGFCALFNEKKDIFYLDNLYILKEHRHNGYATKLINKILTNHNKIYLIACNEYALRIYKYFGFVEYGHNGKWIKLKNF